MLALAGKMQLFACWNLIHKFPFLTVMFQFELNRGSKVIKVIRVRRMFFFCVSIKVV